MVFISQVQTTANYKALANSKDEGLSDVSLNFQKHLTNTAETGKVVVAVNEAVQSEIKNQQKIPTSVFFKNGASAAQVQAITKDAALQNITSQELGVSPGLDATLAAGNHAFNTSAAIDGINEKSEEKAESPNNEKTSPTQPTSVSPEKDTIPTSLGQDQTLNPQSTDVPFQQLNSPSPLSWLMGNKTATSTNVKTTIPTFVDSIPQINQAKQIPALASAVKVNTTEANNFSNSVQPVKRDWNGIDLRAART